MDRAIGRKADSHPDGIGKPKNLRLSGEAQQLNRSCAAKLQHEGPKLYIHFGKRDSRKAVAPPEGIGKVRNFTVSVRGRDSLTAVAPSVFLAACFSLVSGCRTFRFQLARR